ncbi:hypothetical protein ACET3Z_001067 [Daucus carota]
MSSGRRRSGRLISSPWLYNWTKKKPEYVTIDDDGSSGSHPGIVSGGSLLKKKVRGSVIGKSPSEVTTPLPRLDIRRERMEADQMRQNGLDEEEDDFMTPAECFNSSGKKSAGQDGGKAGSSSLAGKSRVSTASIVKRLRIKNSSDGRDVSAASQHDMTRVRSAASNIPEARRRAARCIANRARLAVRSTPPKQVQEKKKRNYEGYLQKKFTPSIITEVLLTLSKAQTEWVKKAGFGLLLDFRMKTYQHRLGYKIVDSFCSRTCGLRLKAGDVLITDNLVHKIIGLPLGDLDVKLQDGKIAKTDWDNQYEGKSISPFMVMNAIKKSKRADYNFKMNFLVLVYNFFIEANQNRWISRKMLSFGGNVDECGRYNWCKLLIDKLHKTHAFWAEHKWRNFAGPLAFLIYCYATCLRSNTSMQRNITFPAYLTWTDDILRERERNETDEDKFGVGSLVVIEDEVQDVDMHVGSRVPRNTAIEDIEKHVGAPGTSNTETESVSRELSMKEMVVPDSVSGDSEEEFEGGCEGMDVDKGDYNNENTDTGHVHQVLNQTEHGISDSLNGGQREQASVVMDATANHSVRKTAGHGVKKIKVVCASDRGKHDSPTVGQSTQARADIEIERHFDEEPYMQRFEANMLELEENYNKCLSNYIESMALYPDNEKLAELKRRFKQFFQMFAESSPITKSLSKRVEKQGRRTTPAEEDTDSIPSFSLGCSQVFPQNLGDSMDNCVVTPAAVLPSGRSTSEQRETREDYIFEWRDRSCTKAHFQSLRENAQVESTVIDTWTHMLNENELLRAESSPMRLFLTSETIYGPMLMNVAQGDVDARLNRYQAFDDNMDVVLELVYAIHGRTMDINEFEMSLHRRRPLSTVANMVRTRLTSSPSSKSKSDLRPKQKIDRKSKATLNTKKARPAI